LRRLVAGRRLHHGRGSGDLRAPPREHRAAAEPKREPLRATPDLEGARRGLGRTWTRLQGVQATDSDPVALQPFDLAPEPGPAEVLGAETQFEAWALRLSGGPVKEVLTINPGDVEMRQYVFAVPLDVMERLAQKLTEVCERQRSSTRRA